MAEPEPEMDLGEPTDADARTPDSGSRFTLIIIIMNSLMLHLILKEQFDIFKRLFNLSPPSCLDVCREKTRTCWQMLKNTMLCVPVDEPTSCSSLTTKELQQNWRAVKKRERPVKLLFEISSTRVVEQPLSKYVVRPEVDRNKILLLQNNLINQPKTSSRFFQSEKNQLLQFQQSVQYFYFEKHWLLTYFFRGNIKPPVLI